MSRLVSPAFVSVAYFLFTQSGSARTSSSIRWLFFIIIGRLSKNRKYIQCSSLWNFHCLEKRVNYNNLYLALPSDRVQSQNHSFFRFSSFLKYPRSCPRENFDFLFFFILLFLHSNKIWS